MTVLDLYNKIEDLIENGDLYWSSPVTFHAYVADGVTVEWKDEGVFLECHNPRGDGLEINVDCEGTGIIYKET